MTEDIYDTKFDAEPEFWQFLNGLIPSDLIIELIQNDLDAHATHTRICFGADRLVAEGDGEPVDAEGWRRLSYIRGAGKEAPRKRHRIGVKNHGLKTCFTIGDEILIQSDGKQFKQTLYRHGLDASPTPGAYKSPVADATAPARGCRIEVPYRHKLLVTSDGEPLEFAPPSDPTISAMFLQACEEMPNWLLGVVRPGLRERYVIQLEHHVLGVAAFSFRCTPARAILGGKTFRRVCDVQGSVAVLPRNTTEAAFCFEAALPVGSNHEIPDFYQAGNGFLAELAWAIDVRGRPVATSGIRRYPIAYTGEDLHARSGLGVHYSGPFISDQERRGASSSTFNEYLTDLCDAAVVRLLRDHLVERHGTQALSLLVDVRDGGRLLQLTERLLAEQAIPLAGRRRGKAQFGPRRSRDGTMRPVVVPVFKWNPGQIVPALREVCPKELDQVDSDLPKEIVSLLAGRSVPGGSLSGWEETRVTFDEKDALDRLQPLAKRAYFPWPDESAWRRALTDLRFALRCLDILADVCTHEEMSTEEMNELQQNIYLPDTQRFARPLSTMFLGNQVPGELTVIRMPALLHDVVAKHRLFRKRPWRPKNFAFNEFLDLIDFDKEDEAIRKKLWSWLRKNSNRVPRECWPRLATSPIWPCRDGQTYPLAQLCLPRDAKVAATLVDVLRLPASDLLTIKRVRRGGQGSLVLRSEVSNTELASFCQSRLRPFPRESALSDVEVARFRSFEDQLAILAADRRIALMLPEHAAVGLAQNHELRPLAELHASVPQVTALCLLPRDVLDRPAGALDSVLPVRSRVSSQAIISALEHDAARTEVLVARLSALAEAMHGEGRRDAPVATIPCVPNEGCLLAPRQLAFKSHHGDYWGAWKVRLSGASLGGDVQELFRFAGVTSAEPNPESSLAFFEWLNAQPPATVIAHLEMIFRHLAHDRSVRQWWEMHDELPCIPVQIGAELHLLSLSALRRRSGVFLADFPELVERIRSGPPNPRLMLAIMSHPNVGKPIGELLRDHGARSLRETSFPISVGGEDILPVPAEITAILAKLRSKRMANLAKRLDAQGFSKRCLREQWRNRLTLIGDIRMARSVTACYRLAGRVYPIHVKSGFDERGGVLWLRMGEGMDLTDAFFEALVDLMFEGAPKFTAAVLEKAVRTEFREIVLPVQKPPQPEIIADADGETELPEDAEPGEAFQTHHPSQPDPSRNVPHPGPIPTMQAARIANIAPRSERTSGGPRRRDVAIELLHKGDLKQNQYAWHCQVCLATRQPSELAPGGSYVEPAENRQKVMEAHHLDQVDAGGARHAGNLMVLCYRHHHELGNALSRDEITSALVESASAKVVSFPSDRNGKTEVPGYLVSVCLASTGQKVAFFFTAAHREHWLASAQRHTPEPSK